MCKKLLKVFAFVFVCVAIYIFADAISAFQPASVIDADLETVKSVYAPRQEYQNLFLATGLGKRGVKDTVEQNHVNLLLERLRAQIQAPVYTKSEYIFFPTTKAEVLVDAKKHKRKLDLPPVEVGDILITKSTETLLYRHGHAGIVVDDNGKTVESFMLGVPSDTLNVKDWTNYSTLIILRPKERHAETAKKAALYAKDHLMKIPYNLFTGVVKKDKSVNEVDSTQCAHLVWQAYYAAGLDIDGDGGWLVTPHDITKSSELEVVFSFGFGDEAKW